MKISEAGYSLTCNNMDNIVGALFYLNRATAQKFTNDFLAKFTCYHDLNYVTMQGPVFDNHCGMLFIDPYSPTLRNTVEYDNWVEECMRIERRYAEFYANDPCGAYQLLSDDVAIIVSVCAERSVLKTAMDKCCAQNISDQLNNVCGLLSKDLQRFA